MGYACPVCGAPQRDAEHLADHLAFTALVHGDDHEEWLDEHAPGWADDGTADLAPRVADLAEERDYDEVFEDTAGGHAHGRERGAPVADADTEAGAGDAGVDVGAARVRGTDPALDDDVRETVERARAMTREMVAEDGTGDGGGGDDAPAGDADSDSHADDGGDADENT